MNYKTLDSGQRQEYTTGMVRDLQDGKPDFSLCMPEGIPYKDQCLTRWASLMERGRIKYGRRNWEKAETEEELQRFRASAYRHFVQWYTGETDEDHLAATWFNMQAVEFVKYKQLEYDSREITFDDIRAGVKSFIDSQGETPWTEEEHKERIGDYCRDRSIPVCIPWEDNDWRQWQELLEQYIVEHHSDYAWLWK